VGIASDTCGDAVPALLTHLHQFAALQGLKIVVFAKYKHILPSKLLDLRDVLPLKGLLTISLRNRMITYHVTFSGSALASNP
jgi:hypothetical protein